MSNFLNLGTPLNKDEQRKLFGGSAPTKKTCNCHNGDPAKGQFMDCECGAGILTCCGDEYSYMNCTSCS